MWINMDLEKATKLAETVVAELSPMCVRAEVAGDIRRKRPVVDDVDLVLIPKEDRLREIFKRCRVRCAVMEEREDTARYQLGKTGMVLNLYFAREAEAAKERTLVVGMGKVQGVLKPGNWGSIMLYRTGSAAYVGWLTERARRRGLAWNVFYGVFGPMGWPMIRSGRSQFLAGETEEQIYNAMELDFAAPELRELCLKK
jgi:DNA polymerase/3'-5' exonuclease PolX